MAALRVAYSVDDVRSWAPKDAAVTLGVFDGVHLGHKRIIKELVESRDRDAIHGCYAITFEPHPLVVTHSRMTPPLLTTLDERLHLLAQFDVDGILVLRFDKELANVAYRSFIEKYLLRALGMKLLVLGYDCCFGKNREGCPDKVREVSPRMGFECRIVPAVRNDEEAISSTKIRNALMEGDLPRANSFLGHPYLISGEVVKGHGKGRKIGFPTANLSIVDPYKLWPPEGVYAVTVQRKKQRLGGMMNVGHAPTMKRLSEGAKEVEVHIFDFDDDIYGEHLWVNCHRYLRPERQFDSVDALTRQLESDRVQALESLGELP